MPFQSIHTTLVYRLHAQSNVLVVQTMKKDPTEKHLLGKRREVPGICAVPSHRFDTKANTGSMQEAFVSLPAVPQQRHEDWCANRERHNDVAAGWEIAGKAGYKEKSQTTFVVPADHWKFAWLQ
jgi:hypothetical protein